MISLAASLFANFRRDGFSYLCQAKFHLKSLDQIDIYNRQEVLDRCNNACGLPRADRKAFAHQVLG